MWDVLKLGKNIYKWKIPNFKKVHLPFGDDLKRIGEIGDTKLQKYHAFSANKKDKTNSMIKSA